MGKIREALNDIYLKRQEIDGLTQDKIADRLGCAQSSISHYLSGERPLSDSIIEGLCDVFGVKLADLENWNPELAKIRFAAAPDAPSSESYSPGNKKYHTMLEAILNGKERKWANGIKANLEAMVYKAAPSKDSPEQKHVGFTADIAGIPGDQARIRKNPTKRKGRVRLP